MICPSCKNPNQENSKECEWCGSSFEVSHSSSDLLEVVNIDNKKSLFGIGYAFVTFKQPLNLNNHPFYALTNGKGQWIFTKSIFIKYNFNGLAFTLRADTFGYPNKRYPNAEFVTARLVPSNNKDRDCFPLSMQGVFETF